MAKMPGRVGSKTIMRVALGVTALAACVAVVIYGMTREIPPEKSPPIRARLELAAGDVQVDQDGAAESEKPLRAISGTPLRTGASVATADGARALVRLPDGSSTFLRGASKVELAADSMNLETGEYWLDVPALERNALVHRAGDVQVTAADAGLSFKRHDGGATVYVARGMAVVTSKGGRAEVKAGEQAVVSGDEAPKVAAVAFWDDWTGGMADFGTLASAFGPGTGTIYGVDAGAEAGSPAQPLSIKQQSVRVELREGLSETEVDQTFFNPSPRAVEGWYWFAVPEGATVTGFAVETNGVLVDGEFIERREAAQKYEAAKSTGHAPAILEWVDGKSYRARIFPVPATGTRRVVLRYLELRPVVDGKLSYLYPMGRGTPVRIGEFSLSVGLGDAGRDMEIATLDDARIEDGGRRVTMRRSGYTPRSDFQLEAKVKQERPPLVVSRFETGGDAADYLMTRYTPAVDWSSVAEQRADVVVVVDTSADGDETTRQLKASTAEAILRALSNEDRFALMSLDVRPKILHPDKELAPAADGDIAKALERLAEHASGGATDMAAMFDAALARVHNTEQPAVIYVGDGLATSGELSGEQLMERLKRALGTTRARLFTVAVGSAADEPLLGELARAGGGKMFRVELPGEATQQALELVAAMKVPTIVDFELDFGAGLDEPFWSASGKVPRGSDVVLLARTHHDLPKTAKLRGRLGGKPLEEETELKRDDNIVAALVPKLWAAQYVRRLLGAAAGPEAERGRIVSLGLEYGLVTPFTSILALESEAAYSNMGIQRNRSPLRGVKLGALTPREERNVVAMVTDPTGPVQHAFACNKMEMSRGEDEDVAEAAPAPADAKEGGQGVPAQPVMPSPAAPAEEGRLGQAEPQTPTPAAADAPPRPEKFAAGAPPVLPRMAARESKPDDRHALEADAEGGKGQEGEDVPARDGRLAGWRAPAGDLATCSDIARRPLAQRVVLWDKRLRTAQSAAELVERHVSAQRACELNDWRAEREFLRLMQRHVDNEAEAEMVLRHFGSRPEVQRFVAGLILRRVVDERVVTAVERVLFGAAVDWNKLDRELSEIADVEARIERLREAMARAPEDPNGQIRLVQLLAQTGRSGEALALGRRLRDQGLMTLGIARKLGDVLARQKLEQEAVRTYSEIVEFDPSSRPSRVLLGDIYLAHGWYEPAYRQYETATELEPNDAVAWLRLAAAAAGSGRVDEALRLERRVASAQGRPGPSDPRRFARLWSAARLARLIAEPPKDKPPSRASLERKLKELALLSGPSTLVLVTWEDLGSDVLLLTRIADQTTAVGESIDGATTGLGAVILAPADRARITLEARLRSEPRPDALALLLHEIAWDGSKFKVTLTRRELAPGETLLTL